jgi:hypothetical protein
VSHLHYDHGRRLEGHRRLTERTVICSITRMAVHAALAPSCDILPQTNTDRVTDTYEQIMVSLRNGSKLAALLNER